MYVTKVGKAQKWLNKYLTEYGKTNSRIVKSVGNELGYPESTIKRALHASNIVITSCGFPRQTYWEVVNNG